MNPTNKLINGGGNGFIVLYSILTPVYNREDCIRRCIDSVIRNLSHGIIEHIIVDDGSNDETPNIVQKYADKYSHINFIRFPYNRGTNAARNAAVNAAKGKFCIILDSDDYFTDDAINTINETLELKPDYLHYLFAPDDMQSKYSNNLLLQNHKERVLSFADFLSGNVDGDFVHVVHSDIMKRYPFEESLRIYEGVFFLRFYREAKRIMFTNRIVTIRDRSRKDSVTREVFRTSIDTITKIIRATELLIEWFYNDYCSLGLYDSLCLRYYCLVDNYLLLGNYDDASNNMKHLSDYGVKLSTFHRVVYVLRCGFLYRFALKAYLIFKYEIMKSRLT